jgi:hypothetical protein
LRHTSARLQQQETRGGCKRLHLSTAVVAFTCC